MAGSRLALMRPVADVKVGTTLLAHDGTIAALETSDLSSAEADATALAGCLAAKLVFAGPTCGKQSPSQDGFESNLSMVQLVYAAMKSDSNRTLKAYPG